jgi:protein TonB
VRGSAAILVIGLHVVLIYVLAVSMGVVPPPPLIESSTAVFVQPKVLPPDNPSPVIADPARTLPVIDPTPPPEVTVAQEPGSSSIELPVFPSEQTPVSVPGVGAGSGPVIETGIAVFRRFDPVYPPSEVRGGHEGLVRLRILVDERGRARDVQVAKSSGYVGLDNAAVKAVRRWEFSPATRDSNPLAMWTEVSVVFRLDR